MSSVPSPSGPATQARSKGRLRGFWHRISEGRQLDELWSQFTADTRASYGFYMKEADAEEPVKRHGWHRWSYIVKTLFWSLVMKLTPARRVLLIVALVLMLFSSISFRVGRNSVVDVKFEAVAALIFLLLLSLE